MQFYARYQDEVVADPATIAEHVDRARRALSPAFGTIFDELLVRRTSASPPSRATRRRRSSSWRSTTWSSRARSA